MKLLSNMDCRHKQDMLVSIINFNQRKIEELLRLRNTTYQSQAKAKAPSKVPILPATDINQNQSELRIPKILITNVVEESTSSSSCQMTDQTEVIVDHSVPLVEPSLEVLSNDKPPHSSEVVNDLDIPGFDNSESVPGCSGANQDLGLVGPDSTDNVNKSTAQAFVKLDPQSQILRKSRDHRKKCYSSSTAEEENRLQAQKTSRKRKRCNSLSSIDEQAQLDVIISSNKWSKMDVATGSPLSIATVSSSDPCSVATKSDDELKKKTKIIKSSPRKKTLGLKPPFSDKLFYPTLPAHLEPYVACWRHCPALDSVQYPAPLSQEQHCFSRSQFIEHLQEFHMPPTPVNLKNQQIVCICHSCENVVNYSPVGKKLHLDERCSNKSWNQQFFLFIENVLDKYGIPDLNFPVVQSPGLEGMFRSLAHHPHLDTMAWKNTKNEHFCYHYCNYCKMFIADTVRAVSDHASRANHRVNVRKSGH